MANISSLIVKLEAQTAAFNAAIEKSKGKMTALAKGASSAMGVVGKAIKIAATAAAAGVASITAAFTAGLLIVNRYADGIDKLAKHANKLGIVPAELQKIRYAAGMAGVEVTEMDQALQRMVRRIGSAAEGGGPAVKVLEDLGLSARELVNLSPDQQLAKIGNEINKIGNQGQKLAATFAIFDIGGAGLLNYFASDLSEVNEEFDRLGLGISRSQAAMVEMYNDTRSKLSQIKDGFFNQLTVRIAPALEQLYQWIINMITEFGGMDQVADRVARKMLDFAEKGIRGIAGFIRGIGGIETGFLKVQKVVVDSIGVMSTYLSMLSPATWANKFGLNVQQGATADLSDQMAAKSGELSVRIRESENRFSGVEFEDKLQEVIDNLRLGLDKEVDPLVRELKDNTLSLQGLRKTYSDTLNDRIQGGRNTGSIDITPKVADKQFKSAEIFEKAAQRFQDRINKGLLDPRAAAMNIQGLQTMISRYQGAGGFDIEGMKAAVENLGAAARDMFATPQERPLTAADYERVFNEAQAKAREQEAKQEAAWQADIEAAATLKEIASAASDNSQEKVKVDLNLTTDRGQLKGEIIASPEMARAMQQIVAREVNNTARGVAA